jgi:hypothetical protein
MDILALYSLRTGSDLSDCTVRIFQHFHFPTTPWEENDIPRVLTNYPTSSIKFFRKPYHSDIHLDKAFRHFIAIPDNIFPPIWFNRCKEENTTIVNRLFSVDDTVLANWTGEGQWYPGIVARLCNDGLYEIAYDDGDLETNVSEHNIKKRSEMDYGRHPYY